MYDPTKPYKAQILDQVRRTWANSPFLTVRQDIYPVFQRRQLQSKSRGGPPRPLPNLPEVDHTDGIGTKGVYHYAQRTFAAAAQDALAMNLNDLALMLARPYKLQNHIALQYDDHPAILETVEALADACLARQIVMTGGETSVMETVRGIEVSLTVSGFVQKPADRPNLCQFGDLLIGLPSSGLHANGFTLVRQIFGDDCRRPELVEPTAIYLDQVLELYVAIEPHGLMNITGGAFTKLKDILPAGLKARLYRNHRLQPQSIFREIQAAGVSDQEMYRTFNCGIGLIVSVRPQDVHQALAVLEGADVVGEVMPGAGQVEVPSAFSWHDLIY